MACKIEKASNGKINKILDESGNKSTLFQQILNTPVLSLNEAIDTYKNIYSSKLKDKIEYITDNSTIKSVIDKLKQTGLADQVNMVTPQQIEQELIKRGVDAKLAKQVSVWHGSPHLFNRFSLSAIGTGEGNQAFGWGLYFTDLESIAKNYAEVLADSEFNNYIKEFDNKLNTKYENFYDIVNNLSGGKFLNESWKKEAEKLIKAEIEFYKSEYKDVGISIKEAKENLKLLNELVFDINNLPTRNLYKTTLHKGKQPSEYTWLEWDKPMNKALEGVIDKYSTKIEGVKFEVKPSDKGDASYYGYDVFADGVKINTGMKSNEIALNYIDSIKQKNSVFININGKKGIVSKNGIIKNVYADLSKVIGGDKQASLFLLENGIDGIKYPAESISRGATSDNTRGFNYVVFDENTITIEEVIQFQKAGLDVLPNGFVDLKTKEVFINQEVVNLDTPIHEFNHLFTSWQKENRPDLYRRGISLIEQELNKDNSDIKDVIDYVKNTQPDLKGESLNEEILTELVGRKGAELIQSKKKTGLIEWLKELFKEIGDMLGILDATPQEIANMTIGEFAEKSAAQLLKGEDFVGKQGEINFNKWKGDNKLVENDEIQEVSTGEPIVIRAYHGTTNEFYEFDSSVKGNIEGHLGKVNYFTSDYQDASQNYLAEGADITGRIDRRQDELEDSLQYNYPSSVTEGAVDFDEIIEEFNLTEKEVADLYPKGVPDTIYPQELSRFLAERELKGTEEKVLELYVKLNNPVVLGNGATWFDALEIDEVYLEEATQEIVEEYDITEEEAKNDYEWEIRTRAVEKQGDSNKIVEALEEALYDNGYESSLAFDILGDNYYEAEVDLNKLEQDLRNAELYDNYDGELASSQVIADFFKKLGFDGIILTDVAQRFRNMGLGNGTSHIHVFDEYNNQIKLADGSNVTFGQSSDIRYQKVVEPNLSFETPTGETFSTYKEALRATNEGKIKLKVDDVVLAEVDSDTNIDTFNGTINHFVKQGGLTGERILDTNGDIIYVTEGQSETAKHFTAELVEKQALKLLGQSGVSMTNGGDFILQDNLNKVTILGNEYNRKDIDNLNYEQLVKKFNKEIALEIEASREYVKALQPTQTKKKLDDTPTVKSEDELVSSIKNLLNNLGIKITSIEDYIKHNTLKNDGVAPESSALMDLVNKIMAFRDGNITREDLIEETMHLIEASIDPSLTSGIRANIHKTEEWKQYAQQYFDIYSKEYSGDKLDEMVRREILGKVMANGVMNNFQLEEGSTLTQQSIFNRIVELLQEFFNTINNFFKPQYQQQIDTLNNDIYAKLMAGTLTNDINLSQNYGTKFRLYSVSNNTVNDDIVRMQKQAEKALSVLRNNISQLGKEDSSQTQLLKTANDLINKVQEKVKNNNEVEARLELIATFSKVVNIVQKQTRYLERALKKSSQNKYPFSSEEMIVYNNLVNEFYKTILPAVEKPLNALDDKTNEEKRLLEAVNKANNNIANLIGNVQNSGFKADEYVINMLTNRLGLDAETQEFLIKKVEGLQEETNWFFMQFGNLSHSSNIFLNSLGHIITKTDFDKRQGFQKDIKSTIESLSKTGFLNKGLSDLAKGNYIQSVYDFDRIDEAINQKRYDLYYKFLEKDLQNAKSPEDVKTIQEKLANKLTVEEFSKLDGIDDLSSDSSVEFRKELELWQLEEMKLSPLNLEATKERRQKLNKYHKVTQDFEQDMRLAYSDILRNSEIVDGKPIFTEDMRYELEDLRKLRVENKNIYDRDGNLKKGLTIVPSSTPGARKIDDRTYVLIDTGSVTNDSILAVELNEIDNERMEENKKRFESSPAGISDSFKETLSKMEGKEAFDFLMLNSYVGYNNEYYDNIKRETVIDKLENVKTQDNIDDIDELIFKITTTQQKINNILKANRMMNHPSEINFDRMDALEVTSIRDYSTTLENYYSEARRYLGKQEQEEVENSISETIVNRAFADYVYDTQRVTRLDYSDKDVLDKNDMDNINKIFSVIEGHVTESKKAQILEFKEDIKRFSKGKINKLGLSHKKVFKLTEDEYSQMTEEEVFAYMTNELLHYSYSRLLPYFKKNQPINADIALNQLEAGVITSSEFINNYENGAYPYLQITPNYNFQEVSEDNNKSKHFQNHINNGTPLFRIFEDDVTLEDVQTKPIDSINFNKYVNKDFLKEYDVDLVELYTTGKEVARKSTDKFEARQVLLDLQKENLRKYDMFGKHNLYQLPQKEKSKTRKFDEFLKSGKGIKSVFEEMVNFREDEAELGQDAGKANSIKTDGSYSIPKYGLRRLKDAPVTDDLLESYTWMNYKANEYMARKVNIGDALALNEALMGAEFEGNIDLKTSRVYRMFKESMDYNFYGVKEVWSKQFNMFGIKFDLAKILNNFGQMIRFRNLGFTVISPITSATTGSVFLRIENLVGEIVDKDAIKTANRFFLKYAGDASREILSLQSKTMLNSLGELYGWYDPMERYENTAYGKVIRGLGKSPFAAHQLANFPVNTRVGLSVLANSKFVNGEMLEYRQYKQQNKGKSDKELRLEWENYTSVLDTVKIDDNGTISYDYDMISTALGTNLTAEQAKDFIDNRNTLIKGRIKSAIQNVDGQISTEDKSMSTRNAFFSFMNIHRSWLMIATQKKWKSRQLNTSTGYYEEGSYRNTLRVFGDVIKDAKRSGVINTLSNIRKRYNDFDDVTKLNVRRTLLEWSILNTLVGLTLLAMSELGDDDEDSLLFKQGSLFLFRTTNEVASSTVALHLNIYDTLENVIVGLNTIEIATDATDIFSSDVIERGRYRGLTESERYFYRHAPMMRDYNNLFRDIEGNIKSYNYFNFIKGKNLDYFTIYPFFLKED